MEKIDTSTNSKRIQDPYLKVVKGDPNVSFVVYSVDKNATLDVSETGNGSLDEFVENFTDGQVQFGLARVTVPGSDVWKNILVGWCPDNAPAKLRMSFANNFAEISKIFSGYHIQITARDQDDLDVDDFLNRVSAAAGARYSTVSGGTAASKKPTNASKPVVSKPVSSTNKPSFVPKTTGKPISSVNSGSKPKPASNNDDGWGDAQDVEERDFDEKPLEDVPSTYRPTKVNIDELRKQKSDTVSSTPKSKFNASQDKQEKEESPKPLSERMKTYEQNDGRLTSLPKPKVGHSVADRYKASASSSSSLLSGAPSFGAKPTFGATKDDRSDKVVGGLSRNFGAENGKTPAQIWAEKRGKYKTVASEDGHETENEKKESFQNHASELASKFEKSANINDDEEEEQEQEQEQEEEVKKPASLPARNLPPPPRRQPEPEPEEEEEEEEEEERPVKLPARNLPPSLPSRDSNQNEPKAPSLPARNLPPASSGFEDDDEEEEEDEDDKPASLPARNLPPPPPRQPEEEEEEEEEEPVPVAAAAAVPDSQKAGSVTATAEYDYEKDEDNEIGFEEGDLIVEIDFVDEDWWSGKHSKTGEVGLFPANYVTLNE
ncbi:ABP1 [Candida theae]|uniref:ABP1 n=1 Tax=Candida theae TaxID=1198502 RepID=A0AAD5FWK0_9ASCO|nr:ABP1 [Candida theae]KAI5949195.1 ABP1 [Candida theae]